MTSANQPHYGPVQNSHRQMPYSSQQSHRPEAGYGPDLSGPNGHFQPGFEQYPPSSHTSRGTLRNDYSQGRNVNMNGYNREENWGSNEGYAGGILPMQQQYHGSANPQASYYPTDNERSTSEAQPPGRDRHQDSELRNQFEGLQDSRKVDMRYQPDSYHHGSLAGANGHGDAYQKPYLHPQTRNIQHYNHAMKQENTYHDLPHEPELRGSRYHGTSGQSASLDYHASKPVMNEVEPMKPSRAEILPDRPQSSKRAVKAPASPETVSWDSPFPTFPTRPKKGSKPSQKVFDGAAGTSNYSGSHGDRPQTANSKESNYSSHHSQDGGESFITMRNDTTKSHHTNVQDQSVMPSNEILGYGSSRLLQSNIPGNSHHKLRPPLVPSRHSENDRVQPSVSTDLAGHIDHERSRTMPAAVSEMVVKPYRRPNPPDDDWQVPSPIDGYHGPEDRDYTPVSSRYPLSGPYDDSHAQPRSQADDRRPHSNAVIRDQNLGIKQPHTPQDSLGDVLDNYYEPARPDQFQYREYNYNPYLSRDHSLEPTHPQDHALNNRQNSSGLPRPPARSRSQPDLKHRPLPRQQHNNDFNFGIPVSSNSSAISPVQTSHAYREDAYAQQPSSGKVVPYNGQHDREQGDPRSIRAGHHNDDRNVLPVRPGPPIADRWGHGPHDRSRNLPPNGRMNNPNPTFQYHAQNDRLHTPPWHGGPPRREPAKHLGGRSFPNGGPMGDFPTAAARPQNRPLPPGSSDRSHKFQARLPDSKPLPSNQTASISPPLKIPTNPDALPAHPAPVRAGLVEGFPVNQATRPAPVRQYNASPSPMQLSSPSQRPESSRSTESKGQSAPITHEELERLRHMVARNPNDMATQLVLAKKLVEAASVLFDDRADSKGRGKNRDKHISDAHKIVKKLSGNGYTEATFYLADCYTRGSLGLECDTREAFRLYQTAAKSGHAQAAYRVAVCCEIGQEEGGGTSRDPVKAMQWYKRAATLGDTPAMYKLGIISLKGLLGQTKNPNEAISWLRRAAERADQENPHALHELALLYEKPSGHDGINKDEAYSKQLFTQAANLGYKFSQYRLGSAYEYGLIGCPVDPRQSIAWYSKAAVQEEHQSELALSGWYLTGSEDILQQSDTEAYLWARKAAQAGLAKAEYAMGYFTEVGIGVSANLEDAKRWYWRAASQNFPTARTRLEDLRKGGPIKRKERVSRSNMKKPNEGECTIM